MGLLDNWTNNGTISVVDPGSVELGNQNDTDPLNDAFDILANTWTNDGTITIADGSTIDLGGIITTDAYEADLVPLGVSVNLAEDSVYLVGTMNNDPSSNPKSGGTLALSSAEGTLYLAGGEVYHGNITSADGTLLTFARIRRVRRSHAREQLRLRQRCGPANKFRRDPDRGERLDDRCRYHFECGRVVQ